MLKVGLLGAGRIGNVHAQAITAHPTSRLIAVSDVNAEAAAKLANSFGAEARTSDNIVNDPSIDAVLIATPTNTHSDFIEAATRAGKSVLCEKPVDLSLSRAQACQKAAAKTGQPVMIGFNRRFDPNFAALKTALEKNEIGKGELLSITSFDPAPPPVSYVKVSGGLFRDMMIHDFDMACWIMGAIPKKVMAIGSAIVDPEIGAAGDVDTAVVTLQFADGRVAVIKNSRRAVYGYDQRVEILGSAGLLSAGNVLESTISKATEAGVVHAKPQLFFLERYMRAYIAEWSAFVHSVTTATPLPVTLEDGVNALAVAEAATRSAKTGSAVDMASVLI
jgi:myo-inositol 2-dehydrogenase / D-chiro-inositol 1-dehydrogenase